MKLCQTCSRHLRADATTCPFCHAATPSAPTLAAISLAAGLALGGCGDDGKSPGTDSSSSSSSSSSSTQSTAETSGTTNATTSTTSTTTDDSNGPVAAYGGPPTDTITDGGRGQPAPDDDAPPSPLVAEPAPKATK